MEKLDLKDEDECEEACVLEDSFMCLGAEWHAIAKRCRMFDNVAMQSELSTAASKSYFEIRVPRSCEDIATRGFEENGRYFVRPKRISINADTDIKTWTTSGGGALSRNISAISCVL